MTSRERTNSSIASENLPGVDEPAPPSDNRFAAMLRGFGPVGILAFLIIEVAGPPWFRAVLVLLWAWFSRTSWRAIGFVRPRSWVASLTIGIVFGIAFKVLMKAVVMPLLGADPINWAYHFLVGNGAALPSILLLIIFSAGFGEEIVFRGFTFERLGKLFGRGTFGTIAIIIISSAWFGIAHYSGQGLAGVEQAAIVGLVFGTIFALTGSLWLLIVAHIAFDLTAVAIIYWNLETRVAHLLFK
jgi:membrane protease YdiL (CAAX protease family)